MASKTDLVKKTKAWVEGDQTVNPLWNWMEDAGTFVQNCVESYVYEYLFYAGSDNQITDRLNQWLKDTAPDWAIDVETSEVLQLKEGAYQRMLTRMWDLHPSTSYASRLFLSVKRLWNDAGFDGNETAVILAENYWQILYQGPDTYLKYKESTRGWIGGKPPDDGTPTETTLLWPPNDPKWSFTEGSTPGRATSTNLVEEDILTFLQLYRATGLMSRGAGPGGTNDVSDGFLSIMGAEYQKQWHISLWYDPAETMGHSKGYRFIPVLKPDGQGFKIDDEAATNTHYTTRFYTLTGPQMKIWYETWSKKNTRFDIGQGSPTTDLGDAKSDGFKVSKVTHDFPNTWYGGVEESAWAPGTLWIGYPTGKPVIDWTSGGSSTGHSTNYKGSAQSIAYYNMQVVAAIASCYPGLVYEEIQTVLERELKELVEEEDQIRKQVGSVDSIFAKETLKPDVAGLKPYNDQCFLLEHIRPLSQWRATQSSLKQGEYQNIGIIGRQHKAPGNLISYLNHGKKTDEVNALLNLCPDVYALLTPYIKIYRVDYQKDKTLVPYRETEIPFPTFIDPDDIEGITSTDYGRFPGAGIKSFSWNLDGVNPAEVENNISANLVLHFQTIQDFFSLNTSLKAGADQAGYLDLVIGSGTSFNEKPLEAIGEEPEKKNTSSACMEAATSKYEGERFRIKIVAGWNTPPGFENIVKEMDASRGKNPSYGEDLKDAIDRTRIALYLQNTTHELTFNEDGSVGLNIDYQASLSGILRAPNADIFTGGTEHDQKIEELEKDLKDKDKEIEKFLKGKPGATADDEELTIHNKEKEKILEKLNSLIKKEKSLKYKRFLCNLYTSGKIYSLKIPRSEFKLLKDLSPAQRAKESRRRIGGDIYKPGFTPQNPTNADLDGMNEMAAYMVEQGAPGSDSEAFAQKMKEKLFAERLKDMSAAHVEIPYFYLGDFIDGILGYLRNIVSHKGEKVGSFQFLVGQIELLDPLLAFQIKTVDIMCGNAQDVIISRALADVNPLKFRGMNQIKFSTSIANLPISLEFFQEWFVNNVVRSQREKYPFLQFIKAICSSLIAHSFNSACFEDALKYHLRFDTNVFNFDKSYTGIFPTVDTLAESKARADDVARQPLMSTKTPLIPSIVLYSVDSQPTSEGDYTSDLENGIYHYYLGASCGIAKKIQFQRQNMPYYREARIGRTSALSAVQLRELYNAQIDMIGNNLHRNGQYLFINPVAIGAGNTRQKAGILPTFAQLLGIGGYYLISKVSHEVSAGGFDVSVTAIQEGQSFAPEGNGIVGLTTFSGDAIKIKEDPITVPRTEVSQDDAGVGGFIELSDQDLLEMAITAALEDGKITRTELFEEVVSANAEYNVSLTDLEGGEATAMLQREETLIRMQLLTATPVVDRFGRPVQTQYVDSSGNVTDRWVDKTEQVFQSYVRAYNSWADTNGTEPIE